MEHLETARKRVHTALDRFAPEGWLNDHSRAQAEMAAAIGELSGPDWSKVPNYP